MEQLHPLLQQNEYLIRRKLLFGRFFQIYDSTGSEVLYLDRDPEEFMIFSDENKSLPLLKINIKQIKDTALRYTVIDMQSNKIIGYLQQGLIRAQIIDRWSIMSADGEKIGAIKELNLASAILSRSIGWIYPQKYVVETLGREITARVTGTNNSVVLKNKLQIEGLNSSIDRRLLISAGLLLTAIEGWQVSFADSNFEPIPFADGD